MDLSSLPANCDVLVAGAGAVGMLLALLLKRSGLDVVSVDPRMSVSQHSRAIGIHPPGLYSLEEAGLVDLFVDSGKIVTGGWAYVDGKPIGRMGFDNNPGRWKYPLVMPQNSTEDILEQALASYKTSPYLGCRVVGYDQTDDLVEATIEGQDSTTRSITCTLLVGCDGKRSTIRSKMGSTMHGGKYGDRYVMGDFIDRGSFGSDAIINLHRDGLVESFPLPGEKRRWVARLGKDANGEPSVDMLTNIVASRMHDALQLESNTMFSSFGIERWRADRLVKGRVVLAGDAAHVVSPIGGQGMNLGWMDASDLTRSISGVDSLSDTLMLSQALANYERRVQKRAKAGIRRAWFNTMMGRTGQPKILKLAATHLIVNTGMQEIFARRFTMLDL
jgi:2-polyprenyl-6-methoxyphenol hydroxylase-like FAD-dependent oxidoreductase